jgi:hypothetical protein
MIKRRNEGWHPPPPHAALDSNMACLKFFRSGYDGWGCIFIEHTLDDGPPIFNGRTFVTVLSARVASTMCYVLLSRLFFCVFFTQVLRQATYGHLRSTPDVIGPSSALIVIEWLHRETR